MVHHLGNLLDASATAKASGLHSSFLLWCSAALGVRKTWCFCCHRLAAVQACVLYVLKAAVVPHLPDTDLRRLLDSLRDRLVTLLATPPVATTGSRASTGATTSGATGGGGALPASAVCETIAVLSTISATLSALGDLQTASASMLRDVVHRVLIASGASVSYAAAAVLGQLAAVEGSSAAELMLDYLSLVQLHTASLGNLSTSAASSGARLSLSSEPALMACTMHVRT